ncbi:Aste57867_11257 [Aphanomyces stellatus]|uniref:Aste57867_11257 protein n=1 Tax=Aphanomyces stellatus TaxID=120398 RepID=A0A485KSH6_9STRA|nr:hypothetical protein As57867_011215 [Aphanomyces stellatus]VFT88121.1 Aste57867_11257 [Aphanomyces stellatus]
MAIRFKERTYHQVVVGAAASGRMEMLLFAYPHCNPIVAVPQATEIASVNNHHEISSWLIDRAPGSSLQDLLISACSFNNLKLARSLLWTRNGTLRVPQAMVQACFQRAVRLGCINVAQLIGQHCNSMQVQAVDVYHTAYYGCQDVLVFLRDLEPEIIKAPDDDDALVFRMHGQETPTLTAVANHVEVETLDLVLQITTPTLDQVQQVSASVDGAKPEIIRLLQAYEASQ